MEVEYEIKKNLLTSSTCRNKKDKDPNFKFLFFVSKDPNFKAAGRVASPENRTREK